MSSRSDALTQDVELALQVAIGQANNPYGDLNTEQIREGEKKRKKKKHGDDIDIDGPRKKNKKSKDRNPIFPVTANKHPIPLPAPGLTVQSLTPVIDPGTIPLMKKGRKKRNNKGKQLDAVQILPSEIQGTHSIPIDPSLQNIRSTLPTDELVAALKRVTDTNLHESQPSTSPLQGLVGDASGDGSEELLRILQELDLPKIAGVLKSFGNFGDAQLQTLSFPCPSNHFQDNCHGTSSATPPNHSNRVSGLAAPRRPPPRQVAQPIEIENRDHAYILANKWLSSGKLAEMAKDEGLVYKKGKFSALEDDLLAKAIENYRNSRYLSDDEILQIIKKDPRNKDKNDSFWFEITSHIPLRPVMAVYHHTRRLYDTKAHQGRWMPEEDAALEKAVSDLGQRWETVCLRVGRNANDCRDRWRNHLEHRATRLSGPWSKEEEDQLTSIVLSMTTEKGVSADNDVFWVQVSKKMGNKRTRQQCRIKWYDALNKTHKNKGDKPRWSLQDAYILVCKLASLNINDDTEVDWKLLNDEDWNLWSAHQLQRRFRALKKSVKGNETMSFHDILDILKEKKAGIPPQSQKKAVGKQKHLSREYITDEDAAEDIPQADSGV